MTPFEQRKSAKELSAEYEKSEYNVHFFIKKTNSSNLTDIYVYVAAETEEEIADARSSRKVGKHVIPVPAIEIKRKYPNIFYKPFLTKNSSNDSVEKSLVRPEFSKAGKVVLSEAALCQMVMHCVLEFDNNIRVKKITIKSNKKRYVKVFLLHTFSFLNSFFLNPLRYRKF